MPADAPVIRATRSVIAYLSSQRLRRIPAAGNAILQCNAFVGRNAEQIGRTPDDALLEFADVVVRIDQLPHHLDDPRPALLIDRSHDQAGEVDRYRPTSPSTRVAVSISSSTAASSSSKRLFSSERSLRCSVLGDIAVDGDEMHQQRRRGQPVVVVVEFAAVRTRSGCEVGDDLAKLVQHQTRLLAPSGRPACPCAGRLALCSFRAEFAPLMKRNRDTRKNAVRGGASFTNVASGTNRAHRLPAETNDRRRGS